MRYIYEHQIGGCIFFCVVYKCHHPVEITLGWTVLIIGYEFLQGLSYFLFRLGDKKWWEGSLIGHRWQKNVQDYNYFLFYSVYCILLPSALMYIVYQYQKYHLEIFSFQNGVLLSIFKVIDPNQMKVKSVSKNCIELIWV